MDGFSVSKSTGMSNIGSARDTKSLQIENPIGGTQGTNETPQSFADTLKEAIGNVNQLQKTSDKGMQDLATGKTDNVADVMIASEKADIALRVMVQVRNKIVDAYQEIMKMQV
jgi:flagellar hook-basal body complex protein FliE